MPNLHHTADGLVDDDGWIYHYSWSTQTWVRGLYKVSTMAARRNLAHQLLAGQITLKQAQQQARQLDKEQA